MPKVGLVYDPVFLEHNTGSHPENAMRLKYILDALDDYGIREKMTGIKPVSATVQQLARFHQGSYIDKLARFSAAGGGPLDGDTIASARSYDAAVMAAGAVITAVDSVYTGQVDSAFALVRPPGHHATSDKAMGFCLFNNVVAATWHAKDKFGVERILIVDWDAHHGNGTADAFSGDPSVLYFSTHQQGIFPGTGRVSEVGNGKGEGYTVNVPLAKGTGDAGFYFTFTQILAPIADQFKPQLVIVSAGFDAHHSDTLAALELTCRGFAQMAKVVKDIAANHCDGKVVLALEGGYNLGSIGHAATAVINEFGEFGVQVDEPGLLPMGHPKPTMRITIDEAINVQKRYWKF